MEKTYNPVLFLDRTPDLLTDKVEIEKICGKISYVQKSEASIANDGTVVLLCIETGDDIFNRAIPISGYRRSLRQMLAFINQTNREALLGEKPVPEIIVSTFHSGETELHLASPWSRFCESHGKRAQMLRDFDLAEKEKVIEFPAHN